MRILIQVRIPHEPFNSLVREGGAGTKIKSILEELKPEAVYFTEYNGQRGCILIADLKDSSEVPKYAEPFFLSFNADVEFHVVMTPEELGRAGLEALGKKWA